MLKAVYFFLGLAVVAYIANYIVSSNKASNIIQNNDDQVVCTADAMQCPDGSFVGRVGPSCEFAACSNSENKGEEMPCTDDVMICPNGSYSSRDGFNQCQFSCAPAPEVSAEVQAVLEAKADLIKIASPLPNTIIANQFALTGEARGQWFFEGSFPIFLTNWDGLIIYEGFASARGEWMTTEFVPFSTNVTFTSPYQSGDPDFMKNGTLILKKDNPSDLPELDDALEIPVRFAE